MPQPICPTATQTDLRPGETPLPGCGSANVTPSDVDGWYDCLDCGSFFTAVEAFQGQEVPQ